jgi:hypothetical protein
MGNYISAIKPSCISPYGNDFIDKVLKSGEEKPMVFPKANTV